MQEKVLLAVGKRELNANRRTSFIVFIIKPVNKKLVCISRYRTAGIPLKSRGKLAEEIVVV